jgi:prepilin-type N-terminal cleavage/methylation domain-containing protein
MLTAGRDRGFTLIEIVVMLAIMLVLASVIAPSLIAYADEQRAETTAAMLTTVSAGLVGANGFRATVSVNAGRVSQLTTQLVANNAAVDDNSCGAKFTVPQAGAWATNAPYAPFTISRSGLATPIGIAEDTMSRSPAAGAGVNQIVFKNVDLRDVLLLDAFLDAGDGAGNGIVRWNTPPLVMFYRVPIDASC